MKRYGVLIGLKPEAEAKYREHHGTDFAADMAKMAADKTTQEWWAIMMPLEDPFRRLKPSGSSFADQMASLNRSLEGLERGSVAGPH